MTTGAVGVSVSLLPGTLDRNEVREPLPVPRTHARWLSSIKWLRKPKLVYSIKGQGWSLSDDRTM